jgi:hypothetical protein
MIRTWLSDLIGALSLFGMIYALLFMAPAIEGLL